MLRPARLALFDYGFRPFFLAAGLSGALLVPAWLLVLGSGATPLPGLPVALWHAHEMLYGVVAAAIAGFLLTAVPSSTARRGFAGAPLLTLAGAWLAGRVAFAFAAFLPPAALAADLLLLPLLAALLAPPLLRERNRNAAMLAALAALWSADAACLAALWRSDAELASRALLAAMNVVLLLLTIVGGRVVPAFTGSALRRVQQPFTLRSYPVLERALPAAMLVVLVADAWAADWRLRGGLALVVGLMHALRLSGWRSLRLRADPILWALHVAYGWLPLGFLLKACALLAGARWAQYWQHAFGAGAFATMILAVAARTTLGHTGRPLQPGPAVAAACASLTVAALTRVFGPAALPGRYFAVLVAAATCWTLAFVLFVAALGPALLRPRPDGRPG